MKLNIEKLNINIIECKTFWQKLIGLMFKKKKINYGFLFKNCNAIHTFFMRQNIDVIMTDKNNNILYYYQGLKPNKIIWPKKNVKMIYELPVGSIKKIER